MKMVQSSLQRDFVISHKGKNYFLNYLNSSESVPSLLNRYHWEIFDENQEELNICELRDAKQAEKEQIRNNIKLRDQLIKFCIKHFNDYSPDYKKDF